MLGPAHRRAKDVEVMSINRFEIQEFPRLKWFVLISLGLHITAMVAQGLMPDAKRITTKLPAVKVKYLAPEKKAPPQKVPTLADIPKPRTIEKPKSSELIARYDSRAHSNRSTKKSPRYKNKKTVVPKTKKSVSKKSRPTPKKKTAPKPTPKTIKKPFRPHDKGFALPKSKGDVSDNSPPKQIAGGTLALLEGFDPDKYAAMATESDIAEDDGEAISLDTRETKYASYFARIKRQIELSWDYPNEAQRKGITGQLTLRFQISRDGNLTNVRLINGSGYNILDEAALQAVKSAAPYYPFPVTIDREKLAILANFIYSPRSSAQYFPHR
jgi:periplasmic protein TonB